MPQPILVGFVLAPLFIDCPGLISEVGSDGALGFNVNIPFNRGDESLVIFILLVLSKEFGDSEYLGAFHTVVIPIASAFRPSIVILAAGLGSGNVCALMTL